MPTNLNINPIKNAPEETLRITLDEYMGAVMVLEAIGYSLSLHFDRKISCSHHLQNSSSVFFLFSSYCYQEFYFRHWDAKLVIETIALSIYFACGYWKISCLLTWHFCVFVGRGLCWGLVIMLFAITGFSLFFKYSGHNIINYLIWHRYLHLLCIITFLCLFGKIKVLYFDKFQAMLFFIKGWEVEMGCHYLPRAWV